MMKVIFVCSGNTCRSPMAEGYLKSKNLPITVYSRGFMAGGECVSEGSREVMNEVGIDISAHTSNQIGDFDLDADKIICMSPSHAAALVNAGASSEKVSVLGGGISDPFGGDITVYRACRDQIFAAINNLIDIGFFFEFTVRKMNHGDISRIAELEKLCFSEPWSENALSESLDAGTLFFVAQDKGEVIGYIGISVISGEGYITNVAVFPEYRKKGVASALLSRVLRLKNEMPLEFVSLEVRASNDAAISLYNKVGFLECGRRKGFYRNPTEDAIIMTRRF